MSMFQGLWSETSSNGFTIDKTKPEILQNIQYIMDEGTIKFDTQVGYICIFSGHMEC